MNKYLLALIILLLSLSALMGQGSRQTQMEQETVTFLETTNYNDALQILETFSWKYERKKIINLSSVNDAIGIPIHNLTWRKALEMLVLKKGLVIEETVGAIMTKTRETVTTSSETGKFMQTSDINTKQVRISAVAFNCDKAYLRSLGIDWSTILDGKVEVNFRGATQVPGNIFDISGGDTYETDVFGIFNNNHTIEVNTMLNAIESNELGTVIARPSIIVSSGKKGKIQVGQDVSVKSVDDAGNTTDQFFATGVIMDVEPTILVSDEGEEVVHLITKVERSSATPGAISTVINKSQAETDVVLYDGEETVIGGLYDTDELNTRSGIPILKDLPWWVFGIRYLTGYYKVEKKERELVFIIKAEVIEDALTRMKNKQ
ncbi:MAG: type II and III secretion system protein [Candidatus Cloacimonadaceae bacterium]